MPHMHAIRNRAGLLVSVCLLAAIASGSTINVPAQQPTIQAGINAAANGDTVLVAPGTYTENINFSGKAITVTSSAGPAATIIDGGQNGSTVVFATGETKSAVLSGFTIRNASQGGISFSSASPTIKNNIITQNTYAYSEGCAMYLFNSSPLIQGNLISNNSTADLPCYGAIVVQGSSAAQFIGNVIAANQGTAVDAYSLSTPLTFISNSIIENQSNAINFQSSTTTGQLTLVQNVIADNNGIGVFFSNGPVLMVSNTITNNSTSYYGTVEASEVYGQVVNNQVTMENNLLIATGYAPALSCDNYDYSNVAAIDHNDIFAANSLSYGSVCPDLTGAAGNITADPLFAALLSDNVHLTAGSPAIKGGNNSAPQLPSKDMDGDNRIINTTVDIGADEYSGKTATKLSTYNLRFGSQKTGSTSGIKNVTLSNNGIAAASITMVATGAEFSQTNNCGSSLAAAAKCTISIKFSPEGSGLRTGVLAVVTGATQNPMTAVLTGTGLTPNVSLNPAWLDFGSQMIGTPGTQNLTLTNTGQAPLAIAGFSFGSSDYTQTNNCPVAPATLTVGGSCTITVKWVPTTVGWAGGTLTITDNAVPNTQTVSLQGYSYSAGVATLTPSTLTFPTTLIGSTSAAQNMTLTNTGTGPLGSISINSDYQFPETNNCPSVLAPGASCTIAASFAPVNVGIQGGSFWVYDDSTWVTVPLSGQGQAPIPTLAALSLSSVVAGSGDTRVTATGSGFFGGSQVLYDGVPVSSYNSGTNQMTFTVPAATLAQAATGAITVYNPLPGGGTSNSLPFSVYAPINYAVKSTTYSYTSITGTNLKLNAPWSWAPITSPFAIQFGGGSFTNLNVFASGAISFSDVANYLDQPLPYAQVSNLVAPFWASLYAWGTGTNNNVFWNVLGTPPNRRLIVEWRNLGYYTPVVSTQVVKFEVIFYEGNSQILVNYADTVFGGSNAAADNGATASVGVQVSPTVAYQYSYNTASLASGTSLLWYPNAPTATVSSSTLNFGWDQIGTPTAAQKLTLTNGSLVPLHMSGITSSSSDFTTTNNCGSSVAAGASCSVFVTFNPSSPVAESATLTINDDALGGPQSVTLNGIGAIQTTVVFPINLRFGLQNVGTSATLPITLANAAATTMTIQSITAAPSAYMQTNTCGSSLAPGASCTINVTFTPTAVGLVNGTLSMGLNGTASQVMVNISGQGQ